MIMRPDLRGTKSIAEYLGVCVRTMWTYATQPSDPLPMFKLGGTCVASRRDLDAWTARALRKLTDPAPVPAAPPRPKPAARSRLKPRKKRARRKTAQLCTHLHAT